jgi:D-methionine transport system substrate-binding protein
VIGKLKIFLILITGAALSVFATGCHKQEKILKIASTPVPHAEILEAIKSDLNAQGIELKIVEVDDYNLPNRLLFEKQVDANYFQHEPYLNEQNRRFGYNLKPLVKVHFEPLGIYSSKITSLENLKEGAVVSIPNDPTNEARALTLLAEVGLIKLKEGVDPNLATIYDISENPKDLKIQELDAAFLPRSLADVEIAVIPLNFALQANIDPFKEALVLEPAHSPYANLVAIREEDLGREELQKLKEALNSEKLRQFIKEKYKGAIIPAF